MSDPDTETERPPRDGALPGHTLERGNIAAKAGTNGDHGHVAGTKGRSQGLVQVQGQNTIITVEVVVRAGIERKRMTECAERVGAELPVHLPSEAETQQWMHKRPWLEGWKGPRNFRSRRKKKCWKNSSSNSKR